MNTSCTLKNVCNVNVTPQAQIATEPLIMQVVTLYTDVNISDNLEVYTREGGLNQRLQFCNDTVYLTKTAVIIKKKI